MMSSFTDEFLKIAVSRESSKHTKARSGRRPIRAHNLVKKAQLGAMPGSKSLLDKLLKWKVMKYPAAAGAGAYGYQQSKDALEALRIGRMIQERQQGQ